MFLLLISGPRLKPEQTSIAAPLPRKVVGTRDLARSLLCSFPLGLLTLQHKT